MKTANYPPQRIVSVVPSQTELLFDLGLDREIVGVTKFCAHPASQVKKKTVVGGTKTLHLERIHALKPDFVLANREENTREQVEELQRFYPVHVTDLQTVAGALAMIQEVGQLVGKAGPANALAQEIENAFRCAGFVISRRATPLASGKLSVAYLIWRKPYMAAASQTFIHSMLETAGFQPAFGGLTRYPEVTEADLQACQPNLIFLSSEPYPFSQKHTAELQQICPDARIVLVDGELFSWYGSRMLKAPNYLRTLRQELGLE
ncbi:helical backbone metal receptor [Larkinella harenae]